MDPLLAALIMEMIDLGLFFKLWKVLQRDFMHFYSVVLMFSGLISPHLLGLMSQR